MSNVYFLFDENLPHSISRAINEIECTRGNRIVTSTTEIEELGRSATDLQIVNYAISLRSECYIVTNDKDFNKRILYSSIMKSKNTGLFLLKFPRGSNFWRKFTFIVNHWEGIIQKTFSEQNPMAYKVGFKNKFDKI